MDQCRKAEVGVGEANVVVGEEEVRTEASPENDLGDHCESLTPMSSGYVGLGGIFHSRFDRYRRYDVTYCPQLLVLLHMRLSAGRSYSLGTLKFSHVH